MFRFKISDLLIVTLIASLLCAGLKYSHWFFLPFFATVFAFLKVDRIPELKFAFGLFFLVFILSAKWVMLWLGQ